MPWHATYSSRYPGIAILYCNIYGNIYLVRLVSGSNATYYSVHVYSVLRVVCTRDPVHAHAHTCSSIALPVPRWHFAILQYCVLRDLKLVLSHATSTRTGTRVLEFVRTRVYLDTNNKKSVHHSRKEGGHAYPTRTKKSSGELTITQDPDIPILQVEYKNQWCSTGVRTHVLKHKYRYCVRARVQLVAIQRLGPCRESKQDLCVTFASLRNS